MGPFTDYGHTKAKSSNSLRPKFKYHYLKYLGVGCKGSVFCRNNVRIMENMDKELTVQKCVLIVWLKIPEMPQKISAQNVCPCPKFEIFEKNISLGVRSPWAHQ